jgi:hypothetical protein
MRGGGWGHTCSIYSCVMLEAGVGTLYSRLVPVFSDESYVYADMIWYKDPRRRSVERLHIFFPRGRWRSRSAAERDAQADACTGRSPSPDHARPKYLVPIALAAGGDVTINEAYVARVAGAGGGAGRVRAAADNPHERHAVRLHRRPTERRRAVCST